MLNALRCVKRIKEFPLIVGRDFVGVVRARGRSVRDDIQVGDKVWGIVPSEQQGSFAEFVVVNHNTVIVNLESVALFYFSYLNVLYADNSETGKN